MAKKVGEIMRSRAPTVARDAPIAEAARALLRSGLPGVPVVDDEGQVVGVVLLDDLVIRGSGPSHLVSELSHESVYEVIDRLGQESKLAHALTAAEIMRTDIPPTSEDAPAREVANCMADAHCDLVPVVREGKPVGVVTKFDLLRSLNWGEEEEPAADEDEAP